MDNETQTTGEPETPVEPKATPKRKTEKRGTKQVRLPSGAVYTAY